MGIKHSELIKRKPKAPTKVWLTNTRTVCATGKSITFKELSEVIDNINEVLLAALPSLSRSDATA